MATPKEIDDFLNANEKKAYRKINYQIKNEHDSLDIVQEAMIKLVQNYQSKPISEYSSIFNTILHNCLVDFLRKQNLNNKYIKDYGVDSEEDSQYVLFDSEMFNNNFYDKSIEDKIIDRDKMQQIMDAIQNLPTRQSEAFLLRYFDELSIEETAKVMNCSQGSVKTHCSRAIIALKSILN